MTVSSRRKDIPLKVKLQVLVRQARCSVCGEKLEALDSTEFDHRPPLVMRPYDEERGEFDPPQNDPDHIYAVHVDCHLHLTTGRKPGAQKTVTTRGSDVGEAARSRRIASANAEFWRRVMAKGDEDEKPKRSRWPKRKFPKRS